MTTFRIKYQVQFVSGNLEGIKTYLESTHPISEFSKVCHDMENLIKSGRELGDSSKYFILDYDTIC